MPARILPIVEGHGEVEAVPILIRRIAWDHDPEMRVDVLAPIRRQAGEMPKPGVLERDVVSAGRLLEGRGAILILRDCEDDDPERLRGVLLHRATAARSDLPLSVVLAVREYESWFLAAAGSLRGHCGLPLDLDDHPDPERPRDAKGWLRKQMGRRGYSETRDQPALTACFDVRAARRAPSFDRCYNEVVLLLDETRRRWGG